MVYRCVKSESWLEPGIGSAFVFLLLPDLRLLISARRVCSEARREGCSRNSGGGFVRMSAAVCGKRQLFDEMHGTSPVAKRVRCSGGASPVRLSPPSFSKINSSDRPLPSPHFRSPFAEADDQLAVNDFHMRSTERDSSPLRMSELLVQSNMHPSAEAVASQHVPGAGVPIEHHVSETIPAADRTEWVELFVREMLNVVDINDAKIRATRALEALEKTILSRNVVVQGLEKENAAIKVQLQGLLRDNHILRKAVTIQHERQLEHEESLQELHQLKQLLSQYQDQIRTLEA